MFHATRFITSSYYQKKCRTDAWFIGGGFLLSACQGGGSSSTVPATSSTATSSPSANATASVSSSCVVTPEGEVGPYFADDSASGFNRSNILSNIDGTSTQTGVSLTLTITVIDADKSCAVMQGVQIDIWHCNASGVYSDISSENTSSDQWLRDYQITNSSGVATFTTIIPGWYSGRTTHIHLRLRSTYDEASATTDGTNTTQLFFSPTVTNYLSTSVSPYSTEGTNPTTNSSDRVYS